jgi:hypothetical protein
MVRYINKDLKAHSCVVRENVSSMISFSIRFDLAKLLAFHLGDFGVNKSRDQLAHLLQKTTIQLGLESISELESWTLKDNRTIKELFLLIEIIMETYVDNRSWLGVRYTNDFVQDLNEFFLVNGIGLQLRYFSEKNEFYIEKIISPEVSEEIKKTLDNFSREEKVFEDFKDAIKLFSSGSFEESIEKCCVSIEDYLCVLLGKESCPSVESYYVEVSKKLKIPRDLDDRFSNIIKYIHKYRSPQNHGAIEKKELPEPELTSTTIIQFTMAILNYLKKKNEKS